MISCSCTFSQISVCTQRVSVLCVDCGAASRSAFPVTRAVHVADVPVRRVFGCLRVSGEPREGVATGTAAKDEKMIEVLSVGCF